MRVFYLGSSGLFHDREAGLVLGKRNFIIEDILLLGYKQMISNNQTIVFFERNIYFSIGCTANLGSGIICLEDEEGKRSTMQKSSETIKHIRKGQVSVNIVGYMK